MKRVNRPPVGIERVPLAAKVLPQAREWVRSTAAARRCSSSAVIEGMIDAAQAGKVYTPLPGAYGQSRDAAAQSGNSGTDQSNGERT